MRLAESLRHITLPVEPSSLPKSTKAFPSGVPVAAYRETAARAQVAALQEYLSDLPRSVEVLDVAAGDGTFSRNLFEQFDFSEFNATWVDQDFASLETGAGAAGFRVRRVSADLERSGWSRPIRNRRFDCALISLLFHHVQPESYERIVESVVELLHPDGKLLMLEVCGGLFPDVRWQDAVEDMLKCLSATKLPYQACLLDVGVVIDRTYTFEYLATLVQARPDSV